MSKFIIVGDCHFGVRGDLPIFYTYSSKFFDLIINNLIENKITDIFQLGDLFDRRKYINFKTLEQAKHIFFNKIRDAGITLHTLVGNHDIFYRESLEVNSSSLVLGEYYNVKIYQKPTTIVYDNTTIDIIPWICKENEQEIIEFIDKSKSDICLGHFEISGFAMYRGMESHEGLSINMFEKYERVFSGHYHTKSQKDNIMYVGTPYEMTWQDYADPKGYHIFDTETRTIEFIQNPYSIFVKVEYDDTKELPDLNKLDLVDCFVKLIVINKTDLYKFDQFVQRLYNKKIYEIKIIEDMSASNSGEIDESINLEDTMSVVSTYIDSLPENEINEKDKLKHFMKSLYIQALNTQC